MAEALHKTLTELQIESKVLTVTADNAANNESLLSELYLKLVDQSQSGDPNGLRTKRLPFQGFDSYVRCLAHVLNLIVTDLLSGLKACNRATAEHACDLMKENQDVGSHSALWIARTPQRKQQWKVLCQANSLKAKLIVYDVDTRWNSTYRMIRDALEVKKQIRKWTEHNQTYFPPFPAHDWDSSATNRDCSG